MELRNKTMKLSQKQQNEVKTIILSNILEHLDTKTPITEVEGDETDSSEAEAIKKAVQKADVAGLDEPKTNLFRRFLNFMYRTGQYDKPEQADIAADTVSKNPEQTPDLVQAALKGREYDPAGKDPEWDELMRQIQAKLLAGAVAVGAAPKATTTAPTGDMTDVSPTSGADLKKLSKGKVNVALNQLRNRGDFSARTVEDKFDKMIKDITATAGPQRRNFLERDVPVINQIKKEIVKILSGDFSSLKEHSDDCILVHPVTYAIINKLSQVE